MTETIVRLNARIANQREEIKHKQFLLQQLADKASRLCDCLGIDGAMPVLERLAQGIEAATAAETVELGSVHESPVGNADAPKEI